MIHPNFYQEIDGSPDKFSRMGKFDGVRLVLDDHGISTSIVVELNGDEHAARTVADRIRRCWNFMRTVADDEFNDALLVSKPQLKHVLEHLHEVIDDTLGQIK